MWAKPNDKIAERSEAYLENLHFPKVWAVVQKVRTFFQNGIGTAGLSMQETSSVAFTEQVKRILRDFGVLRQGAQVPDP